MDPRLHRPPLRHLLLTRGAPLPALGQIREPPFAIEPSEPLAGHLEIQLQRTLDRDLLKPEVLIGENLRMLPLRKRAVELRDPLDVPVPVPEPIPLVADDLRIFSKRSIAWISCTLPRRAAGLRFVTTQT